MKVRQVSNRGRNIIGQLPSIKLGRMVDFESQIERDFIYLIDFDPVVTWYAEQPLFIDYSHEGKGYRYTPDFHLLRDERNVVVEIKPDKFISRPDNQRKFKAASTWCAERDWQFQVVTESQIRAGFRLQNIKRLTQFARYDVPPSVQEEILSAVGCLPTPVTIAAVMTALNPQSPQSMVIPILHMAYHHQLSVPLDDALITPDSAVGLPAPQEEPL